MEIISGFVTFAAELTNGDIPEWVKIAPRGRVTARDGRVFDVSPEALVDRFKSEGISIPVDLNHATILKAGRGEESPAYGWIEELEARPNGLYGRVKWLARGRAILAERSHPFLSPAFGATDEKGRTVWLHSVGLVATPALVMPALASAQTHKGAPTNMTNSKLAEALGLSPDVSESDIFAAVADLKAKASSTSNVISSASEAMEVLSAEVGKARRSRIEARVDQAIKAGTATPALRDFCITLADLDEGMFEQFCAKMGTPFAYLSTPAITNEQEARFLEQRPKETSVTMSTDAQRLAAQLGIDVKSIL
ncbi:phage protease [Gellertiella hungarica]|uniref:Phage I-like protein n=1 Tax=Gellertiella hungarica TaxID=1572859 RepID=A0A7W6J865_9HYPH|nr:phage protease [Gellertiella hungarica]MBB4065691.1 phage I-like protein [Gellertiella hungarica]